MADRVHPSSKPQQTLNGTTTNGATKGTTTGTQPTKPQLYRPYRPPPPHLRHSRRRSGRSCCCLCCLWSTLFIIFLLLLAAIAAAVFYVLYSPRKPTFSLSSLKFSRFNLTEDSNSNSILYTKFNLTLSAKNRNHKLVYLYDQFSIEVLSSGVVLGNGTFPAFVHEANNETVIRSVATSDARELDADSLNTLRSDLKRKNGLPLEVQLETTVRVKFGNMKSTKIGLLVTCHDITGPVPKGKSQTVTASLSNSKCAVRFQPKIWKFTFTF
ncbi:Late embryogenesis abundant protein, LEA_2 subgroup [Dillenia turbinata]|uniref:Late embryogenesis abundant protein, LEA_2 subgroup n=1 Tax=Dillenia turbinata TaxID=194707 RepID=A0AAN8UCG9_9MAGN